VLSLKVKHVEEKRSSLKVFLQNTSIKEKGQKIDEKQLGFWVDVQKLALQMKVDK
jgi:hypothetical protein